MMMDLMGVSNEIQESLGCSYYVLDDFDVDELIVVRLFLNFNDTMF